MSLPNSQKPSTASKTAPSDDWLKPAGTCFGLLLFLAGLSLFWNGVSATPGEKPYVDFITGAVLLGGAAGIIGVAWGWFDPTPPNAAMKPGVFYGLGAALAVFIALFILRCGMHQIGGFDHSILVEVGWRLFNGQTAYVDFPCTTPVAFILGAKFAFQWFGVQWQSNVELTALFAMLTFAWSLFLLAQLFGRGLTTLLWAMALHAISVMLVSFWWYNPITAVAAVLYTLSAMYWLHRPGERSAVASYAAALLLMATMKPNVAGILIPGISVILFISPRHRWKVVGVSLGAFAFFLVLLLMNHLSFTGMLAGYLSVARRGASLKQFLQFISPMSKDAALTEAASLVLPVVLVLGQGRKTLRSPGPWIPAIVLLGGLYVFITHNEQNLVGLASIVLSVVMALCLGRKTLCSLGPWIPMTALLGGLYGFFTNGEQKLVDLTSVLLAAILLVAQLRRPVIPREGPVFQMPVWWNRYLTLLCVVFGAAGLALGFVRDRVRTTGPMQFFEYNDSKHTLTDGFFKGLHCGDIFDEILKEEAEVLRREPSSTVWFGPRMQWGYAAFGRQSPLHEPVIWDPGVMLAVSDRDFYFNNFLQSRRQLLILFKNDLSAYAQNETQRILQQYDVDQSFPLLTLLRLKK